MADRILVRVSGDKALAAKFKALPPAIARENLLTAVAAGAEVIKQAVKDNINTREGQLEDSIQIEATLVTKSRVAMNIGPEERMGFYGSFVEFGHTLRHSKPTGVRTTRHGIAKVVREKTTIGVVAPRPFMRPGFDQSVGNAIDAIMIRARRNIERVARTR